MKKTVLNRILRLEKRVDSLTEMQTVSTEHFQFLDLKRIAIMVDTLATSRQRSLFEKNEIYRDFKIYRWLSILAVVVSTIALCMAMLK